MVSGAGGVCYFGSHLSYRADVPFGVADHCPFTRFQNSIYLGLMEATEGRLFDHHQTRKAVFAHLLAVLAAVIISIPWWQWLGLIR